MKKTTLTAILFLFSYYSFAQKQTEFHIDKTYAIGNTGTIYLKSHDAEVTIIGEDRQDVAVKIDYFIRSRGVEWGTREFRVDVDSKGDDLYITEYRKSNSGLVGSVSTEYIIIIKAPYGSGLDLNGDDDDYTITSINGSIRVNADDSKVVLKKCQGTKFYFDLDDGNLSMDQASGEFTARMDDGDIEIINANLEKIDYRGDDGEMAIETSLSPNAMFKFSGDDATFDIVITRGGGTFTINHDDGDIDYDNNFRMMDKTASRTTLSLTGGRAKVIISGDDIRVNLSSTGTNQ